MRDDPFENAHRLQMRAAFRKAVDEGAHKPDRGPEFKALEERIERVTTKVKAHIERSAPAWIAKENQKMVQKHRGQLKPALSPKWILQTETSPAALAQRAYQNVENRNEIRLRKVEQISDRMRAQLKNRITQTLNSNNGMNM